MGASRLFHMTLAAAFLCAVSAASAGERVHGTYDPLTDRFTPDAPTVSPAAAVDRDGTMDITLKVNFVSRMKPGSDLRILINASLRTLNFGNDLRTDDYVKVSGSSMTFRMRTPYNFSYDAASGPARVPKLIVWVEVNGDRADGGVARASLFEQRAVPADGATTRLTYVLDL